MDNNLRIDLMNCYNYRIGCAKDLSKQPGLTDSEILSIHKRLAQCELIADIIGKESGNYSMKYDFNATEKEILKRLEREIA